MREALRRYAALSDLRIVDAGNVYKDFDAFDADEIRYSAGLAATWMSPLGPFTLSYAKPLNAKDGDEEQEIQFSIGASF